MDETYNDSGSNDAADRQAEEEAQGRSAALDLTASTTLIEVEPGIAVVFGSIPEGLELITLDLMPSFDRTQLSTALGSLGSAGTIVGNIAEAASSAKGLFRVDEATLSLLKSGGQMAAKDGAKLGTILKNGKIVAQARFIPASMTVTTAIAAVGPAVAMISLQMKLGEISSLLHSNIQLTAHTLKAIRNEQWSELEGLADSIDEAVKEARELGTVTDSIWEPIKPSRENIRKHNSLYRKNVVEHVQQLRKLDGRQRRMYLECNAEAITFDTYALLSSLKIYVEYQTIRAAHIRARSTHDEKEAELFDRITKNTPLEVNDSLSEIRSLTESLVRELRIIAELPGRATVPLTKKRKDAKATQLTCKQLLDTIEPLSDMLQPAVDMPTAPATVCAPEGLEIDRYLHILRWYLEHGETLRSVGFPYEVGTHNFTGLVPAILAKRVDATWDALAPGKAGSLVEKFASSIFVAVTDRRIITAHPGRLLRLGELGPIYSLDEVRNVRGPSHPGADARAIVDVATVDRDLHWMFPNAALREDINGLVATLSKGVPCTDPVKAPIEQSTPSNTPIDS